MYNYGCLMLYFDLSWWNPFVGRYIDIEDIYEDENKQFGLEYESHCTVLYGFTEWDKLIQDELKSKLQNPRSVNLKFINISMFGNDEYDVIKFDIDSPDLIKINKWCTDNFKYETDYPNYHPHSTISYVKSGTGKKYVKRLKLPKDIIGSKWVFSYPPGHKIGWKHKKIK